MAIDKAKDDELFNKNQPYEIDYVANQYDTIYQDEIKNFLKTSAEIKNSTHKEVYNLILKRLGYSRK